MTSEQLAVAIRELQGIAQVQRRDLEAMAARVDQMSQRLYDLEQRTPDPLWAEKAEAANRAEWE